MDEQTSPAQASEPTRASADPDEQPLMPGLRTEWQVIGGAFLLPVAVLVLVAGAQAGPAGIAAGVAAVAMLGFAVWAIATSVFRRWRYVLWDEAIEIRHGVIRHSTTFVPFHRIQQVDVERGPLDRAFGLATLVLRTAAATSDAKVPGLDPDFVDELRRGLLVRAGIDDAV